MTENSDNDLTERELMLKAIRALSQQINEPSDENNETVDNLIAQLGSIWKERPEIDWQAYGDVTRKVEQLESLPSNEKFQRIMRIGNRYLSDPIPQRLKHFDDLWQQLALDTDVQTKGSTQGKS